MNDKTRWRAALTLGAVLSFVLAACSSTTGSASPTTRGSAAAAGPMDLNQVPPAPAFSGSITADGATFPQPIYEQWTQDYNKENSGIRISYAGGGSGQGIKDVTANIVSFAGSDAPMTDDEKKAAEHKNGTPIVEIPTVFGGIVMAYHVVGVDKPINFSPAVIGRMFTGQISRWDDAALKADNPDLNLPGTDITVVHRSDGSGTTNAFTSWLCDVSSDWKDKLGTNCKGKEVAWPVGLGGKGNPGVTAQITQTDGSVGYIELAYAVQNKIPYGNVKNKAGAFIRPTLESVAAAANLDTIPADLTFKAWDTSVADGYPITTATWLLVYQSQDKVSHDEKLSQAVVHFMIWALDSGGTAAKALDYAVLPDKLRTAALAKIATISWNGQPIANGLYR